MQPNAKPSIDSPPACRRQILTASISVLCVHPFPGGMIVTRRTVAVGFGGYLVARTIEMLLVDEAGTTATGGHRENGITRAASQHDLGWCAGGPIGLQATVSDISVEGIGRHPTARHCRTFARFSDLTDAQWAVLGPTFRPRRRPDGRGRRGPIRALHLRGETVKRVSLIGRNSGGPLCRSQ